MKKIFYKALSTMPVLGLLVFMWHFSEEVQNKNMTEEEAVNAIFCYMYSDSDYSDNSMPVPTMIQEQLVYMYHTPDQDGDQCEILWGKGSTDDGQYYIFTHYTQYEANFLSLQYYYEYHTNYVVNKETGDVFQERKWMVTDAGGELIYNQEYEKVIQSYFREDMSDNKMTEEEAARALFYYIYPDYGFDFGSMVMKAIQQEQIVYIYQTPEQKQNYSVSRMNCKGLTEDKQYYLFADYTDYYDVSYDAEEINYSHSEYHTDYAVNRETGEVLREREWLMTDTEYNLLYNEEYEELINKSNK